MTHSRALRIALDAIDKEKRRFAVDANIFKLGVGGVSAARAAKRYAELEHAKLVLKRQLPLPGM